ncbi:MAG: hypothetical protein KGJ98_05075 [Chloroflexota bacterium]|nr:hypothetical protein [Chloroflexota bacterium]MDE3101590.1 hypothetical protein [Chloroflexota bacterium]
MIRIGVDVGGTSTDAVVMDGSRRDRLTSRCRSRWALPPAPAGGV